ncbi:tRNA lysidine(34) synthetase TilS [Cellulomonas cellasea]|uniref:tRNA(Ile)-lysidine synthase n=1 Tax=Cellulomonas cellasea TaxID=43670 RepID=A0A7W4UKM9_9CELL|nr:tRNA lysidine(34) synthetase TilS [Cellulomonas cellasea]MBB2925308.1 tRNA(Ile)-lysidine synthetase-like protein [Cellulomonas cellasea]
MAGPAPVVAAARTAVTRALDDVPAGSLVLVACSGGADSLALGAATAFVAARGSRGSRALRAGAVVVDHGLQPGSAEVAAAAADACRALGLDPVEVVRVDAGGPGGPEGAARDARYAALAAAAERLGAAAVLLGHTLDDQAEGVLLGLARGSGARSLAGMATRRGLLRRPFLGLRRTDTEAVCAAHGLTPWHDPTNAPAPGDRAAPVRSRVRGEALPVLEDVLGPGVAVALARTAALLREDADALDALAAELLADAARDTPGGEPHHPGAGVVLDVATLARALPAVRRRALRQAAARAGSPPGSLTRAHVLAVDALVTAWHGQGPADLPGPVVASRACGRLRLHPRTHEGE